MGHDPAYQFKSADTLHRKVNDADIGRLLAKQCIALFGALTLCYNRHQIAAFQKPAVTSTNDGMVVNEQNANHAVAPSIGIGKTTCTCVPPEGTVASDRQPPKALTRSFIPSRPSPWRVVPLDMPTPSS